MKNIIFNMLMSWALCLFFAHSTFATDTEPDAVVNIKPVLGLNTSSLDFSAVGFEKGILFTSNRDGMTSFKYRNKDDKSPFTDLYYATIDKSGKIGKPTRLWGTPNGKYNDGTMVMHPSATMAAFTRNNRVGKNAKGIIDLKIYTATYENGEWTNVIELPFNSDDFSTCHPTFSPDGNSIVFSSNRPGAKGMDLFVTKNVNGTWTEPIALTGNVNSDKNEIFPSFGPDGTLYFASNRMLGVGGLDIYKANNDNGSWVTEIMPSPFNTAGDDFAFSVNNDGKSGYLSSNRIGGKGGDDIYSWDVSSAKVQETTKTPNNILCVRETGSNKPLSGVSMRMPATNTAPMNANGTPCEVIANALSGANNVFTSDMSGTFAGVSPANWGVAEFVKIGYKKTTVSVNAVDGCVELVPDNCKMLSGSVTNRTYNVAVPNAKVTVFNKCTGETETYITDNDGKFEVCLQNICDYEIVGEKEKIGKDSKQINLKNAPSTNAIRLELGNPAPAPAPVTVAPAPPAPVTSNTSVSFGDRSIKVGETLKLDNIYYDFTKFYIREDAKPDLDKVVTTMQRYPNMRIELGSHTDSRGTSASNNQLSYNRAKAAVDYIVSRGIAPDRIVSNGYGESVILNQCYDNVKCTEAEHQVNRRTEVKVLSID